MHLLGDIINQGEATRHTLQTFKDQSVACETLGKFKSTRPAHTAWDEDPAAAVSAALYFAVWDLYWKVNRPHDSLRL